MGYGIKGSYGLHESGGSAVPAWGTGIFLSNGTEGQRVHCTVDGELCVAEWGGTFWELSAPSPTAQAYAAANIMPPGAYTAPTVPQAQRFITLGQGINTATASGGIQSYSCRIVNQSSDTWDTAAIEYLAVAGTDLRAAWVGVQQDANAGDPQLPDGGVGNFRELLFGGAGGKVVTGGTLASPEVIWSDVRTLPATCPPGGALVFRWVFDGGAVSFCRGGASGSWPSGLCRNTAFANADAGTDVGDLSNSVTWLDGYAPPLHGLKVGFVGTTPEIQAAVFCDSLVEQERPQNDAGNNTVREGLFYLSEAETERVHIASCGQGGATLDDGHARLTAQLPSLVGLVDLIGFQTPSHNQKPATVGDIPSFMSRVAEVKAEVEAAGLGFFVFTLSGPADDYTADQITAWNQLRADLTALYGVNHVDSAASVMTDNVNNTAYVNDKVHIGSVGAPVAQASFWPKLLASVDDQGYILP